MTDWAATGTMLQGWATLAGAGAVIYAAKRGADTFENFRRQKVTERQMDQAERILTASYKARKALKQVRSPFMWAYELEKAEAKLKEQQSEWESRDENERKKLTHLQAYYHRLERTVLQQSELDECLSMARALFGETAEKAIETLNHQFWLVQVDAESYAEDRGEDREFSRKIRRGIYDAAPNGEENEMTVRIDGCIEELEKICLPVLTP